MKTDQELIKYWTNIKYYLKFTIAILIVSTVILSSVRTGYAGYLSFYDKDEDLYFNRVNAFIDSSNLYQVFLKYTGLDTGYGFFSPNVSSDFIITHKLYSNGEENIIFSNSMFDTKEGALRFANINSLYMDKIEVMENDSINLDSTRSKYLDLILKRMSESQMVNEEIDSVQTTLFLYHFPFLKEFPETNQKLYQIESNLNKRTNN